jgi:hypothetical protein
MLQQIGFAAISQLEVGEVSGVTALLLTFPAAR